MTINQRPRNPYTGRSNIGEGTSFPEDPSSGELFVLHSGLSSELYIYSNGQWFKTGGAGGSVRVQKQTLTSIPDTTLTPVQPFETVFFNDGGLFDPDQPDRLTFPYGGRFHIGGAVLWNDVPSGPSVRILHLWKNYPVSGTLAFARSDAQTGETLHQEASTIYEFLPGDFLQLLLSQDSGGPLNLLLNGDSSTVLWAYAI